MHLVAVVSIVSVLMMLFGSTLVLSAIVAFIYDESTFQPFALYGLGCIGVGTVYFPLRKIGIDIPARDGFLITTCSYIGMGLLCALPFWLLPQTTQSFTNAAFEAFSGLTTTGATVVVGLDELPKSILFYRQILQWLGGMGIIVLAVAILPALGVGGMQLYQSEAPGTISSSNLKPRITETAKTLWLIYLGITLICAFCYWVAGMSAFDAIGHSFSTVAIGGFSTHDASFAHFDNAWLEGIAVFFMLVAGMNFTLHYSALHKKSIMSYLNDDEVRLYLGVVVLLVAVVTLKLALSSSGEGIAFRDIVFQTVSFATTSGFTTSNLDTWPIFVPVLLVLAAFAGGCVGSTAGGIKTYRLLVIARQGVREIKRLIHVDGVFLVKMNRVVVPDRVVEAVWGFFAAYVGLFLLLLAAILFVSELDIKSAFSAVAGCLNNLGPGLGEVADNYRSLGNSAKWVLILAMLLGRLEVFTLLVLFAPRYWRN